MRPSEVELRPSGPAQGAKLRRLFERATVHEAQLTGEGA